MGAYSCKKKILNCALFITLRKCSFFKWQIIHYFILCFGIQMSYCFLNAEKKNLRVAPAATWYCRAKTQEIPNRSEWSPECSDD